MKDLVDLHLQPFQVVGHGFNVVAAFFRQIPGRVFFFSLGLGMLDQIKEYVWNPLRINWLTLILGFAEQIIKIRQLWGIWDLGKRWAQASSPWRL